MFFRKLFFVVLLVTLTYLSNALASKENEGENMSTNIKNITVKDIDGKDVKLSDYDGKVLLIVNVASYCGFTKQYSGLEEIYKKYKNKGFEILAFPCNQFGNQEPGTNEEIKNFCSTNVNGKNKSPLYAILTDNDVTGKGDIKWNFEKFLIDKKGNVIARFPSSVEPTSDKLISALEKELSK
jgi:glutathione peroxidase